MTGAATEGIALRYGGFYGPGRRLDPPAASTSRRSAPQVPDRRRRRRRSWSFIHIEDAAEATLSRSSTGAAGSTTSSTTSPRPSATGCRSRARAWGRSARRVPRWLGRLMAGEAATVMMTEIRGASNAKAKRELGWRRGTRAGGARLAEVAADGRGRGALRGAAAAAPSRSPTGCWAASPRPRTWSRRGCCALHRRSTRASGSSRRARTWRPWSPGSRSTSCARPARAARPTSASGCPSRSSPTPR